MRVEPGVDQVGMATCMPFGSAETPHLGSRGPVPTGSMQNRVITDTRPVYQGLTHGTEGFLSWAVCICCVGRGRRQVISTEEITMASTA